MGTCNSSSSGNGTDLFNNPANNYVNPGLSPCAGASDDSFLEFTDKGIGIVSGSQILANIDFSDISIPVNSYSTETKIISEREVVYIPGLTKGLQKKNQGFTMPNLVSTDNDLNPYFFQVDLSISYYNNFKYTYANIDVSANYTQNVNIEDALNIALGGANIKVESAYDPSVLSFTSTLDGYEFTVSNVLLTIIDTSENSSSPFIPFANAESYLLEEDPSRHIASSKYPNGAVQGIVMKATYPNGSPMCPYDHWLNINHATDFVTIYEPIEIDNFIYDIESQQIISYDPSIVWGPFIDDPSIEFPVFACSSTGFPYQDPSYKIPYPPSGSIVQDGSIVTYEYLEEASIGKAEIYYSGIVNTKIASNGIVFEASIYGSNIWNDSFEAIPSVIGSFISDSSVDQMSISDGFIQNTVIRDSYISDASMACVNMHDCSIHASDITYSTIDGSSSLSLSRVLSSELTDTSIVTTYFKDSSLVGVDLQGYVEVCDVSLSYAYDSVSKDSYIYNTTIVDSSILRGAIDYNSLIMWSTLEGIYTNAYQLWIDPSNYIWVIDDPTLSIDDPSARVEIQFSTINDSSLNNVIIKDSSIYNSYVQDSSLIRCTLYNVTDTSTDLIDPHTIDINMTVDCSVVWDEDSSTFYTKSVKQLDVGMNGESTDDTMSAGDYLDWITVNDYWNKFGDMYIWTTAPDACSTCDNLIDGFYVYNPHAFDIKIEYMLFV